MHGTIHHYSAVERHNDAIREARRRHPVLARPAPPAAESAPRRGPIAVLARRLARPHALRAVIDQL